MKRGYTDCDWILNICFITSNVTVNPICIRIQSNVDNVTYVTPPITSLFTLGIQFSSKSRNWMDAIFHDHRRKGVLFKTFDVKVQIQNFQKWLTSIQFELLLFTPIRRIQIHGTDRTLYYWEKSFKEFFHLIMFLIWFERKNIFLNSKIKNVNS